MITPGWPNDSNPNSSPFIVRQYNSLIENGIDVDLFYFQGNRNPINYILSWLKLRKILLTKSYQLIHAQWGYSAILALPTKTPLVITYRGSDLEGIINEKGYNSIFGKLLIIISKWLSHYANEIVVVSKTLGLKLSPKPFTVIPSGIDLNLFKPMDKSKSRKKLNLSEDKKLILFAASTNRHLKRFELAVKAVETLKNKLNCELIVCENQDQYKVAIYMNAADCLILTSIHEGSPNVIKEALACNLPIVSVNVGDVYERQDGLSHFKICSDDPEELSRGLYEILSEDSFNNNRESVLELEETKITSKLIKVYNKAINKYAS